MPQPQIFTIDNHCTAQVVWRETISQDCILTATHDWLVENSYRPTKPTETPVPPPSPTPTLYAYPIDYQVDETSGTHWLINLLKGLMRLW
jgi:hypothetical protein